MNWTSPCTRGGVSTLQSKCLFPVGVSWPPELYFLPTSTWALELHGKGKLWSSGERQADSQPWTGEGWKAQGWCCNPLCAGSHCLVQLLGCCCLVARTRSCEGTIDLSMHPGKASGCVWKIVTVWHFYKGLQSLEFLFLGKDLWRIYCFLFH